MKRLLEYDGYPEEEPDTKFKMEDDIRKIHIALPLKSMWILKYVPDTVKSVEFDDHFDGPLTLKIVKVMMDYLKHMKNLKRFTINYWCFTNQAFQYMLDSLLEYEYLNHINFEGVGSYGDDSLPEEQFEMLGSFVKKMNLRGRSLKYINFDEIFINYETIPYFCKGLGMMEKFCDEDNWFRNVEKMWPLVIEYIKVLHPNVIIDDFIVGDQ